LVGATNSKEMDFAAAMKSNAALSYPKRQHLGTAAHVVRPKSANDIARILLDTRRYPSPVRAIGAGSSTTRCVDAPSGTQMDLSQMNRILRIDPSSATVQPGITLAELADALGSKGLELIGGFDLANRTIGGALCAAGLEAANPGAIASFVSSITQVKLITAAGKKFSINHKNANLLTLIRYSYGLLGIVYEVTLAVRPIQAFSIRTATLELEDLPNLAAQLAEIDSGVKLRLLPFRKKIHCEYRDHSNDGETGTRLAWRIKSWTVNSALPGAAYALAKMVPMRQLRYPLVDTLTEATQTIVDSTPFSAGSTGTEQQTQTQSFGGSHFDHTSWAFKAETLADLVGAYFQFSRDHYERTGFRCDMPTLSHLMPQDRGALFSPSFDGPAITLTAMSSHDPAYDDFTFEFAEFAEQREGIPLFSHTRQLTPEFAARQLGKRLAFFKKVRKQFDKENRFLNPFFANYMLD
jgi:FAD/FMN-containing dehydrogenase